MRSVADDLRLESRRALASLSALDRIALALRLGDDGVALYRMVHGVGEASARASLARSLNVGRRPSRSNDPSVPAA
jgi:hypothetical protein